MKPFKNKYVMLALSFAGGIIIYSLIKKFTQSKEEEDNASGTQPEQIPNTPITPVSGTSETILNDISKQQAEDIKNELK